MSQYLFSQVPKCNIQRSVFPRNFTYKTCVQGDYLYPVYVDEVLPGDSVKISCNLFARMATQIAPIMDNCYIDMFAFFVPNRLVWDNWQKFMGEQENPGDSIDYLIPQVKSAQSSGGTDTGFGAESLFDYMGIPAGVANLSVNALYARAYKLIYRDWFRSENLINSPTISKGDGPDYSGDYSLYKRAKAHDYFTSCLPWPQKGPASMINIGGYAPVFQDNSKNTDGLLGFGFHDSAGEVKPGTLVAPNSGFVGATGSLSSHNVSVFADLGESVPISINQLRMAYQFQRLLEAQARGGSRYTEILRSIFNVVSPDSRLQRPEFLGMFSSRVNVTAIAQTSATENSSGTAKTPQANLSAMGVVANKSRPIVKSFVEHGILMFILNVRGDINYDQGVPRMFSRKTRNDYYWPQYAHLGEQAVLNREIYAQGDSVVDSSGNIVDEQVFGYIPRYDEYRFAKNQITGKLRGSYTNSLNYWTLTESFTSLPSLNQNFIEQNTPFSRAMAVTSDPVFIVDLYFDAKWARPMPTFGVPGWVDHF